MTSNPAMPSFETRLREEARLVILKALAEQQNGTLSSSMLEPELALYGIERTREWLHQQITHLADIGGVMAHVAGTVMVATLTTLGRAHLDRKTRLQGVKPPSDPEA